MNMLRLTFFARAELRLILILLSTLMFSACATVGETPQDKRTSVLKMKDEVLTELFQRKPHVRGQIAAAPGYAVFSNANLNIVLASFGGGHGLVKNNQTGKITYMKMAEVGVGVGLGVKDFRIVMVFDSIKHLNQFIDKGWVFGAQADAAAKASDKGAAVGGEAVVNGITVYQLTESGLALQATIKGTKFWKDSELNSNKAPVIPSK